MADHEEQIDYRFVAKTVDGQQIEQTVAASNLDAAAAQAWDAIQERDQSGVEIGSAKLEWDDRQDGPQVEYLYDRRQGIETNRPPGITLSHEYREIFTDVDAGKISHVVTENDRVIYNGPDFREADRLVKVTMTPAEQKAYDAGEGIPVRPVREWNRLIEGGSVSANAQERSMQDLKSPTDMTKQEIVTEARDLHARFSEMMGRFETMHPSAERSQLRDEMKPLALRENELRDEYTGRLKTEIGRNQVVSQDRAVEQEISYSR